MDEEQVEPRLTPEDLNPYAPRAREGYLPTPFDDLPELHGKGMWISAEPPTHPGSNATAEDLYLWCLSVVRWERDQRRLAEVQSNPVQVRHARRRATEQRVLENVCDIIEAGEHDHIELADLLHGQPEAEGLKRTRLITILREYLRAIGRPELIRGKHHSIPD